MKKAIVIGLLVCLLLSGCKKSEPQSDTSIDTNNGTSQAPDADTTPPSSSDTTDEVDVRLAYYEQLVQKLQQELLEVRTSLYVNRVEYEARISQLEEEIEKATVGGAEEDLEGDFLYVIENGTATVTSYRGDAREVTVPATLDGCPVIAIGERAFMDQPKLISVTLPDGVKEIGWFAFAGCVSLESVRVPAEVESIAYGAFQNCPSRMKLICAAGSYAEQFARSYGIIVVHE